MPDAPEDVPATTPARPPESRRSSKRLSDAPPSPIDYTTLTGRDASSLNSGGHGRRATRPTRPGETPWNLGARATPEQPAQPFPTHATPDPTTDDTFEQRASGRRIVDMQLLCEGLASHLCCTKCMLAALAAQQRAHEQRMHAYNRFLQAHGVPALGVRGGRGLWHAFSCTREGPRLLSGDS